MGNSIRSRGRLWRFHIAVCVGDGDSCRQSSASFQMRRCRYNGDPSFVVVDSGQPNWAKIGMCQRPVSVDVLDQSFGHFVVFVPAGGLSILDTAAATQLVTFIATLRDA